MIVTLPRRISYLTGEALVPKESPVYRLSPVKNGLLVYNGANRAVGQILKGEDRVSVAIADKGCVAIKAVVGEIVFTQPDTEKGEPAPDEKKARAFEGEFVFFGNAKTAQYELFRKSKGSVKPSLLAQAVAHPLNEKLVNVFIPDGQNVLLAIVLCLGIGYFE